MDIKTFFRVFECDAHISFGIHRGKKPQQLRLRLDDFAEFVVPQDVREKWEATPDLNKLLPEGQFKLLLKLVLEKATGEWEK